MHSIFVIAAAFASVVAAQTTAAPAATESPVAGGASDSKPNAVNVPEGGKMPDAEAGKEYELSWNSEGAADNGIEIYVVYGDSKALTTASSPVFSAASNPGKASFTMPTDIPNGPIGFVLIEEGEEVNYSPQFAFSGGSDAAPSETDAEATATETGAASTLETVTGTVEPTEDAIPTGNTTVTGADETPAETDAADLPTETEEESTESPSPTGAASGLKVSFAALFAGLAATIFAL